MRVKKILSSILAICMLLSTMSFTAFAGSIDSDIDTAIILTENTEIANAVTLSETVTVSGDVTISGDGTITRAEGMTAPMFIVEAGSTLTLENITIDGGAVWTYEVSEDEPTNIEAVLGRGSVNTGISTNEVIIENNGTVVIGTDAVIQNNDTTVIISKSGAAVEIAGGTVCNNNGSVVNADNANNVVTMTSGEVYGNYSAGGGLTYIKGTSTIGGGKLYNNYAGIGGIFRLVSGANVTVDGGEFYNNGAENGGVAYVYCWSGSSTFTINGGEFYNNTATEGGVGFTSGKNCTIKINNGNIHHNSAYTGGAFKLDDYAYFIMNGGTIANNSAETLGGALRQWGSWGTSFNGGVVRDNTAEEGEAIWMGNGLFLSGAEFENNDIYTSDYIRVDEDFAPFMLSGAQTADVRGNSPYELTEEDAKKISVNSLGKFPYFNAETKHVEYVSEHIAIVKGEQQIQVKSLEEALEKVEEGDKIVILADLSDKDITINKDVDIIAGNKARTATTLNNVTFTVEKDASLSLDGFEIRGLSYIYAKTPESLSVTNCDIDVTAIEVKSPRNNTPPAFVQFSNAQGGSVDFTFTGNTLFVKPDETEAYTYSHGITGWNYINSATITNNTFGSADEPFSAAAVKLMNFVDLATVDISNNTIYVNSMDSTWGPNAVQLYQCNSRANKYTATISDNDIYVDDDTAAIGINSLGEGNGYVAVTADNTVNGRAISTSDVIVFGNGINDAAAQAGYIGIGVETDDSGKVIGGVFSEHSDGLEDMLADGYATETDVAGNLHVVEETLLVDEIKVEFVPASEAEGEKVYNINLTADGNVINRLNSVDLTFLFTQVEGENAYEIIASNSEVAINPVDNSDVRYEFHYNGKTDVTTDTNATITIGQVKFTGYGKFSFAVDVDSEYNVAHATKLFDNIVDTFVPGGILEDGTEVGDFDIADNTITDVEITVPTRTLTIDITFPNAVVNNVKAYQDMTVTIVGGTVNETIALGTDGEAYNFTRELPYNTAYTVTVSGAGYRTARYTVNLNNDKQLNFWNNVMDEAQVVEIGKDSSVAKVTFLAGDIVKDNNINIYDLSAVVSYFGTEDCVNDYPEYAKYDLNRDGVIDSKDVAYVLVSWNN